MEEILNHSLTVMFCGTPCIKQICLQSFLRVIGLRKENG